jgi:hypothetical protein
VVGGQAVKKFGVVIIAVMVACIMGMPAYVYSQEEEWPAESASKDKKAAEEQKPVVSPRAATRVADVNAARVTIAPESNTAAPGATDQNAMAAASAQEFAQAMAATDANMTAGVDRPDVNQPEGEWVKALERDVNRMEKGGDTQQWQGRADNRVELARAVYANVTEELEFLRRIATEEGAAKTAKAIDLLIASRERRLNTLVKKLEDEVRQERIKEREDRRTRTTTRPDRTERTRERTSRREDRTPQPAPGE